VVRAYDASDYQLKKFDKTNVDLTANNLYTSRLGNSAFPLIFMCMDLLTLSLI
jgi:hypothetical protein